MGFSAIEMLLYENTPQIIYIVPFLIFQEPAFQELIILYSDDDAQSAERDTSEVLPPQLKIYEKIPIPDLPVSAIVSCMDTFELSTSTTKMIINPIYYGY
jgi:hypothetical protein